MILKRNYSDNGDKSFDNNPDSNENGSDSFIVTLSVGDETIIDTVTVVITPGDDPPEVSNDNITIDEDESSDNIIIVDIDGDPIEGYSFKTGNSGGGVAFYDTMNNKNISFQYKNSSSGEDDRLGEIIDNGDLTFSMCQQIISLEMTI